MVEVPDHLAFIKRQQVRRRLTAEQAAVIRHVEHPQERYAPRVLAGRFVYEHRHATVNRLRELRVGGGAEDRAGAGVRVQQGDLFRAKLEMALQVVRVGESATQKGEVS